MDTFSETVSVIVQHFHGLILINICIVKSIYRLYGFYLPA